MADAEQDRASEWHEMAAGHYRDQEVEGVIECVERWGLVINLGLPFVGFVDGADVSEGVRYKPGERHTFRIQGFAEYNLQVRLTIADQPS